MRTYLGVIAGPFYLIVSVAQGVLREGFDFSRHPWSALANGPNGWIQTANLILTGLMVAGFAGSLDGWTRRLIGAYGVSLVGAGVLRADPVPGFPPGTTGATVSWHGMLHLAVGGIGFLCLVAACLVVGRRSAGGFRAFSYLTGVVFLAGFAGIASGSTALVVPFTVAVVLVWAWLSTLALRRVTREG
ncbi:hypothetical protein Val02_19210 [Virgisporangium aliadipatigenens]|uniref:DUF998 domain-containing protein n=1 Tax=Virgisporangium aliadipatigenens TaxID=741659 RepID=A0A8J3YJ88_9ACTN|nr:DUF998 domain-containing protein [Virgisporangium aliadipatigenens]GIJ45035.1 hypothetical protein Val02_19210 [Virgisporangium aliadipatigenens]